MKLGQMHRELSDATKREMKEASRGSFVKFTNLVYEMHDIAYKKCCCMGKIAPKATWVGVFLGGDILPCSLVVRSIQQFGRCGCGF